MSPWGKGKKPHHLVTNIVLTLSKVLLRQCMSIVFVIHGDRTENIVT